MDCNWCAVCSKHFHSEHQASLYCSDECRKEDALACCAFHDCNHPDGSVHHDHLTFCHHHRPAIRIPSLPLLNLNPNPSAEQKAHGQHQADEWARFLQQQYSAHFTHTSTIPPVSHGQHSRHGHHAHDRGHSLLISPPLRSYYSYDHQAGSQVNSFPVPEQRSPILLSGGLRNPSCQTRQQPHSAPWTPTQLHQHKPMYHSRGSTAAASVSLAGFDASLMKTLSNSVDQQHCSNNASKGEPSSEMKDCEQPCVIRKNKALPPPTLSHILPMTISNPALLSPTRATNPLSPSGSSDRPSDASSSLSWSSSEEDDNDSDGGSSHAWPKMDKFFFPDHCCRTSACPPCSTRQPAGNKKGAGNNSIHNKPQAKNKKPFMSELPPPPTSATAQKDTEGCIALSTSIWGVGWRQVEPLPESFVKMVQKSNLMWAGCERERPNGRHRHRRDSGHGHGYHQHSNHAGNRNRVIKTQQGGPRKAASDVSSSASWATDCSCRLPRSLQFVD